MEPLRDYLQWIWSTEILDLLASILVVRSLCTALSSRFYRFLARFSGRRRSSIGFSFLRMPPLATFILLLSTFISITDACSSRSTPKPRPPTPTPRPNITFHTYECPPAYATWYCLNGATCFTVKIGESLLYNCECADGYMGPRCEYKDLDGSYLPSRQRVMLETASIAGGATIAVLMVFIICLAAYIHFQRRQKALRANQDTVDAQIRDLERRPFGAHHYHTIPMVRVTPPLHRSQNPPISPVVLQPQSELTSLYTGRLTLPS